MLVVYFFWCTTLFLVLCASCFILPPLWINAAEGALSMRSRSLYTGLLVLLLVGSSLLLYCKIGNAHSLVAYYSATNQAQEQSSKLIRPLYASLTRDLVKYELNLPIDINNVDLILTFAKAQSQSENGQLAPDTEKLLFGVLNIHPKQVTALNLLAINAYKKEQYATAISYWQDILGQCRYSNCSAEARTALRNQISQTKTRLADPKRI